MTACMLLSFAACGRGKPTAAPEVGTYAFDHAVILDDTWNPENFADIYGVEPKAAFNEDGTAEVVAHMTLTGTWKNGEFKYEDLFSEKRTATYVLDGDALTIKFPDEWEDGVYKTFIYIRTGTHSGNGDSMSSTENRLVGYYTLFSMESDGEVHDAASLKEVGMDDSYVELLADGTGTLQFSGEEPDTLAWKGEEIYIDGEKLSYVRDGNTLTFDFDGIVMTFSRNGGDAASTDNATADSLAEAFGMGSETNQQTTLTGSWYGWIRESECWGGHKEDFRAAWGYINYAADSGNRKYFDVYKDGDSETPVISMWIDDDATDQYIIPIIGEEDAWVFDTYLETDEAPYFDTFVSYDGVLSITYAYTRYDGNSGCLVELFLRKDGAAFFTHKMRCFAKDDGIRSGKVDKFKKTAGEGGLPCSKHIGMATLGINNQHFAGGYFTHSGGPDLVKGACFRGDHIGIAKFTQHKRAIAPRVAGCNKAVVAKKHNQSKGRPGFGKNLRYFFVGAGLLLSKHMQNQFAVGVCVKEGAAADKFFA